MFGINDHKFHLTIPAEGTKGASASTTGHSITSQVLDRLAPVVDRDRLNGGALPQTVGTMAPTS